MLNITPNTEITELLPTTIIPLDIRGSMVIPKPYRKKYGITEKTRFVLQDTNNGGFRIGIIDEDFLNKILNEGKMGKDVFKIVPRRKKNDVKVDKTNKKPTIGERTDTTNNLHDESSQQNPSNERMEKKEGHGKIEDDGDGITI